MAQRSNEDIHLIALLYQKIMKGTATPAERNKYMLLLYKNGSITQQQYEDYLKGLNSDKEFTDFALTLGGILLLGYLISKIIKD